jgi:hypothetical protein
MSIVNIKSIDTNLIKITTPVKVDNRLHSKIKYNSEKLMIKIDSCKVVDIKKVNNTRYISFKFDDESIQSYIMFEEVIVDNINNKKSLWDDVNIYDCFKKNIEIHKKYGTTFCIKVKNDEYDEYIHKTVDLFMRPNMIKSVNKNVFINWQISDIKHNNESFFVEENDYVYDGIKDNVLGPYEDDIKLERDMLLEKLQKIEDVILRFKNDIYMGMDVTNEVTELYLLFENVM